MIRSRKLAALLLAVALLFSGGALYGRHSVTTERICSTPSMNADHVWHCWDELKP